MLAHDLGGGAVLTALEPWQAQAFADHLDRAREHVRPWVGPSFVSEDVDGARATLQRYADDTAVDGRRIYGTWLDGVLVGGAMFVALDARSGTCELGCWLEPAAEGRGLARAACAALLDWALVDRGLHRAEWRCRADNHRSATLARRLGMTLEGTLREAWPLAGERHDKLVWSVLAHEWHREVAEG